MKGVIRMCHVLFTEKEMWLNLSLIDSFDPSMVSGNLPNQPVATYNKY